MIGWDRRRGEIADVPVSRTLVARAIQDSLATFNDDVAAHEELSEVGSLSSRHVVSVIVVPLIAERQSIGAIYLDSANPRERLTRDHLEFAAVIAEHAALPLHRALRLKASKRKIGVWNARCG
jgi:GAF domain-containing protein